MPDTDLRGVEQLLRDHNTETSSSRKLMEFHITALTKATERLVDATDKNNEVLILLPGEFADKMAAVLKVNAEEHARMFKNLEQQFLNSSSTVAKASEEAANDIKDKIQANFSIKRQAIDFLKVFAAIVATCATVWGIMHKQQETNANAFVKAMEKVQAAMPSQEAPVTPGHHTAN